MEQGNDVDTRVIRAIEDAKKPQDDLIRLSTGVVLRGKQAPPMMLLTIMSAFPRPKPPTYFMEAVGREMENPDDPDYIERVKAWQTEQSNATLAALILSGTELVSRPKEIPGPDEKAWLDECSLLGVPMHAENASWRYLRWVQFKAAVSADDLKVIMAVVGRLSGIPEKAVKSAEEFPGSNQEDRK